MGLSLNGLLYLRVCMKVLLLSDTHSPHTEKWALGLADLGVSIGLFSFNKAGYEWYRHPNIQVFFEPSSPINAESTFTKLSYLKYVRMLRKIIRQFEPDILHAHYATSYGLIGALTGFKPMVLSVWGSDVYNFPNRSAFHKKILQYNIGKADVILSTSHVMKEEIRRYTIKPVEVTPFGVDTAEFSNRHDRKCDGITRVGTIKPIREKYGIMYIIEAAQLLRDRGELHKFRFYLIGAGDLGHYRDLIEEKKLSAYFEVTGRVPFSEVSGYHNLLDIFLNVSVEDSESFGVATVEAMACERPVIVTDVGGLKEVVNNGEFGIVIRKRDPAALADNISRLASDQVLAEDLGKRAREHVLRKYDWKHNLGQMAAIYQSLTANKQLAR